MFEEKKSRKLVDSANTPIFGVDVNGNVNEWNYKTSEITGYTREEAFNKPFVKTFLEPDEQESMQEVLILALKGIETSNYELEIYTKNHEQRFLLVNATTWRDTDNNIVGGKNNPPGIDFILCAIDPFKLFSKSSEYHVYVLSCRCSSRCHRICQK